MAKFFIPDIGFHFRLSSDTTLNLLNESRNMSIIQAVPENRAAFENLRAECYKTSWAKYYAWEKEKTEVEFKAGTLMSVDRVYIRKGASDYSSVSFNILKSPQKIFELKSRGGLWVGSGRRFFIHLEDVNALEFEHE